MNLLTGLEIILELVRENEPVTPATIHPELEISQIVTNLQSFRFVFFFVKLRIQISWSGARAVLSGRTQGPAAEFSNRLVVRLLGPTELSSHSLRGIIKAALMKPVGQATDSYADSLTGQMRSRISSL